MTTTKSAAVCPDDPQSTFLKKYKDDLRATGHRACGHANKKTGAESFALWPPVSKVMDFLELKLNLYYLS